MFVDERIDAEQPQGIEVAFLNVVRRRFQDHLELIIMLQADSDCRRIDRPWVGATVVHRRIFHGSGPIARRKVAG